MELRCSTLQEELRALHEKVNVDESLQEEVEIHGSPSTMAARITKLQGSLKVVEKRYQDAYSIIKEKTRQADKHHKTLFQEVDGHVEALKALKDEFGTHDQVMEQTRKFYPDAIIFVEALNPLQAAFGVIPEGDPGTSIPRASA